jgi:hypothetical protein
MNPFVYLAITVILVGVVALTGTGPRGGKPVARTRLMKTARLFMFAGVLLFAGLGVAAAVRHFDPHPPGTASSAPGR